MGYNSSSHIKGLSALLEKAHSPTEITLDIQHIKYEFKVLRQDIDALEDKLDNHNSEIASCKTCVKEIEEKIKRTTHRLWW